MKISSHSSTAIQQSRFTPISSQRAGGQSDVPTFQNPIDLIYVQYEFLENPSYCSVGQSSQESCIFAFFIYKVVITADKISKGRNNIDEVFTSRQKSLSCSCCNYHPGICSLSEEFLHFRILGWAFLCLAFIFLVSHGLLLR